MYFLARTPIWHLIVGIAVVSAGLFAFVKIEHYRAQRIFAFLNPEIDPLGIGYQIKQALIAIGSGGIMGVGPGKSRQKFGFLPESMSDSIFAIYAEETGFIGALILMGLFIFFLWRAFKISKLSSNKFSQLASAGIISWIIIQAFINIGAMTGIMPLAGIPLPFFSSGGSALVAEIAAIGILLNISKKYS
jgi:cell division protein FtsW